mgnify:CR=1 FL=1
MNEKDDLEKALEAGKKASNGKEKEIPKEVEIAFHNGALQTLSGERHGLIQMLQHVEERMQAHMKRMQELGVKFEQREDQKK